MLICSILGDNLWPELLTPRHNLAATFSKFLALTKRYFAHADLMGNLFPYPHKPALSDQEVIALSLCAQARSMAS